MAPRKTGILDRIKRLWPSGNSAYARFDSNEDEESSASLANMADQSQSDAYASRTAIARKAFNTDDVELSRQAHERAIEKHNTSGGEYVKSAVFGGLDGIMTSFAVVSSVAGASLSPTVVLVLGIANLIADGMAMGLGEFAGEKAEIDYAKRELDREHWEFQNYAEGEVNEMVDLYKSKGFSEEEARDILEIMAKHKNFFVDHMMIQELGLMSPDGEESPAKHGLVMFVAFVLFGLIPKLPYMFLFGIHFSGFNPQFLLACIFTAAAMFTLGAVKAKYSLESWWKSGLTVLIIGAVAASVAYGIGHGTEKLTGSSSDC